MKKTMIMILLMLSCVLLYCSNYEDGTVLLSGGFSTMKYSKSGFEDVRLSDAPYQKTEGSLLLDLGDANGVGIGIGGSLGVRVAGTKMDLAFLFDYYSLGKRSNLVNISAMGVFNILDANLRLGIGGKISYFAFSKVLGTAKILEGTTPPVMIGGGKIYEGDAIFFDIKGISLTPLLDFIYPFTPRLSLGLTVGYQLGITIKNGISTEEGVFVDPKKYKDAFYEPDATQLVRKDFKPKADINGFVSSLYLVYKF